MMSEWDVRKPLGTCAGTGTAIEPGTEYFAALVETEQGFVRQDFSCEYWRQNRPAVYCFWKSKMPRADEKKKLFVDDDMLMTFFERLENETEQEKLCFRFVLALVLMRKRLLKYENGCRQDGRDIWTLKITGQDRTVDVANPNLNEEQIEQLTSQIGQILQMEINYLG